MTTQTGANTRTIQGYLAGLLEFARLEIARNVDFTNCHYDGRYNQFVSECTSCRFGSGCRWLNLGVATDTENASVEELVAAVRHAVRYFRTEYKHARGCDCDVCLWVHEAARFLRAEKRQL